MVHSSQTFLNSLKNKNQNENKIEESSESSRSISMSKNSSSNNNLTPKQFAKYCSDEKI
jgi:hypothetical protein